MKRRALLPFFLAGLLGGLLAGCGGDANPAAADPDLFHVAPDRAKIFFYVAYDNPDDEPSLGEVFRLRIDKGYVQQVDKDEFIAVSVTPEEHTIDVEEISWNGNTESRSTLTQKFRAGTATFLMEHIGADRKPVVMNAGGAAAMPQIRMLQRVCNCDIKLF